MEGPKPSFGERIKKLVKIAAVGATLTGATPASTNHYETDSGTPNSKVSESFKSLSKEKNPESPDKFAGFPESENIVDRRDEIFSKVRGRLGLPTLSQGDENLKHPHKKRSQLESKGPGPFDKDIEDYVRRTKLEKRDSKLMKLQKGKDSEELPPPLGW